MLPREEAKWGEVKRNFVRMTTAPEFYTFSSCKRRFLSALSLPLTLTVPVLVPSYITEGKHWGLGFFFLPLQNKLQSSNRDLAISI